MRTKSLILSLLAMLVLGCEANETLSPQAGKMATADHRAERLQNVESEVERLLSQLTLEEKVSLTHANTKFSIPSIERLGIHEMWMSDGPHGVRYEISRHSWAPAGWTDDEATYLPPLTTVAASWNPAIAELHGSVLGSEARHRRKDFILGPGVNLARLPTYGRNFEYMGEDPYLAARLAVAEIKAIQKNDVAATIKHYALNTQELNRTGVDAKPDERTLREVYLPVFEAAVKEGNVYGFMGAYNEFRGTNANQSKHLVRDILKDEWGYKGVLLTDWNVDINTYDAAMNGLDIEMGTDVETYDDYHFGDAFLAMLKEGKIPEAVLDDKVRRILRVQLSIGMMDKQRLSGQRNTAEHQQAARKIASEGVVLLKNDKVLPLDKSKVKKVLVMGPNASKRHGRGGGSSEVPALFEVTPLEGLQQALGSDVELTVMRGRHNDELLPIAADYVTSRHWTGTPAWNMNLYEDSARQNLIETVPAANPSFQAETDSEPVHITMTGTVKPLRTGKHTLQVSAVGDFQLKVGGKLVIERSGASDAVHQQAVELNAAQEYDLEITYDGDAGFTLGWSTPDSMFSSEEEYIAAAKAADAVIYFGGLDHGYDREAIDRSDMKLPYYQDAIIDRLLQANKNTVVLLIAGSAVEMPWIDNAKAVVWGWYGGMHAGDVYADVLFGDINPSGKMPITLPKALEDTAPIALNDYKPDENLYPEGVFIGYRWFEQQNIEPLFPFGHGLSYTDFTYSDIKLSGNTLTTGDTLTVTAKVTNTGDVAGAEVVQLYLSDKEASVERPAKELKGFDKVFLKPGETKTVTMTLNQRDLSFWDVQNNAWLAEPGEFEVMLGASVEDIRLTDSFRYQGGL